MRRAALRRGLVSLEGRRLAGRPRRGRLADPSWLAFPAGAWVAASPWIWGYDDVGGAIATDVATGIAVIAIALGGAVLPGLWALGVGAGLWLVTAPWLVGFGDADGPVGLSDSLVGMLVVAVSIVAMALAERDVRPGSGGIGRVRTRHKH